MLMDVTSEAKLAGEPGTGVRAGNLAIVSSWLVERASPDNKASSSREIGPGTQP